MASIISAGTTSATALNMSADTTGILQLASNNGTVAVTVNTSQNVGFGTASPLARIHTAELNNSGTVFAFLQNTGGASNVGQGVQLSFGNDIGSTPGIPNGYIRTLNTGGGTSAAAMAFGTFTGSVIQEQMRISSAGYVTTPYQPYFYAYLNNSGTTFNAGTMVFDVALSNVGNGYNTSTGLFTAPVTGMYFFTYTWQHAGGSSAATYVDIYRNGGKFGRTRAESNALGSFFTWSASCPIQLNAGDTANLYVPTSGVVWTDNTYFSGFLVG